MASLLRKPMMSDRFYRATQALKALEKHWEGKPVFERQSALTEDEKLKILDLLSHNINKAEIARRVRVPASAVYNFERRQKRGLDPKW